MGAQQCKHWPASRPPPSWEATPASERKSRPSLQKCFKSISSVCRRFRAQPTLSQAAWRSASVPCSCVHATGRIAIGMSYLDNLTPDRIAQLGESDLAIGNQPKAQFPAQVRGVAVCNVANVNQSNRVHTMHRANRALPSLSARSPAAAEGRTHGSMALVRHPTPSRWSCGSGSSSSMLSNQWPRIAAWDALVDPQNSIAICHGHKTLPRVLVTVRDKPGFCCGHVSDLNFLSHKHSAVHAVRTVFRHTLFGGLSDRSAFAT